MARRRHPCLSRDACTKPTNSGWGRLGRLLNSGWNCTPTNQRVGGLLHDLHQTGRPGTVPASRSPAAVHLPAELVVELIPVPVPLGDIALRRTAARARAALRQHAGVLAQPHGAALGGNAHLIRHQVNDGMGRHGRRTSALWASAQPSHVAGKLDDGDLHPQADAEIRHVLLPGVLRRQDHSLDAPVAEAAGHQNAAAIRPAPAPRSPPSGSRSPPSWMFTTGVAGGSRVEQGLRHAEIRVVQAGILAHQRNGHVFCAPR